MSESEQDKYKGVVESLQKFKADSANGSGGWVGGLIAVVVFLIFIAIVAFQAWQAGKERAKLLHEKTVREEEAKKAQLDAVVASNNEKATELLIKADDAEEAVEKLEEQITEANAAYAAALDQINKMTSWDDIDAYLKGTDQP